MALVFEDENKQQGIPVSFGTTQDRKLFPHHCAFNRLGNLDGIRGAPDLGPDKYNVDQVTNLQYKIMSKPTNVRGYSMGARTANRFPQLKCKNGYYAHDLSRGLEMSFPGPTTYPKEDLWEPKTVKKNKEAFNNSASRFPADSKIDPSWTTDSKAVLHQPAPGTYEHDVQRFRRVEYAGSFGGPQALKQTITIKCVQNNEDICDSCRRPPIGDYYTYNKRALCRTCFTFHSTYGEKYPPTYLQAFAKVRDCSEIHHHEGTSAKIKLKDPKHERKQRFREAYFNLYFTS